MPGGERRSYQPTENETSKFSLLTLIVTLTFTPCTESTSGPALAAETPDLERKR